MAQKECSNYDTGYICSGVMIGKHLEQWIDSELCGKIDLELCKPIFIIHDALVLDVHSDYKNDIVNIVNKGYTCNRLGHFPVEIEKLSETY